MASESGIRLFFLINFQESESVISDSNSADSDSNFSQHEYLNFKIVKVLLEWQLHQISTNDKHIHEGFGIFNS